MNKTAFDTSNLKDFVPFISYVVDNLAVLTVISTLVFFAGVGSNLLALLLSIKFKKEKSAFSLLIELDCAIHALNCAVGWVVLNTVNSYMWITEDPIFVSYGIGGLLGPRFVHALDSLPFFFNSVSPITLGFMMIYRALILYDINVKKRVTVGCCILIGLFVSPCLFASLSSYVPIEEVAPKLDSYIQNEIKKHASYVLHISSVYKIYLHVTFYFPVAVFLLCASLRVLMEWKLRNYCRNMSPQTKKIHRAFLNLLTLDAAVSFIYLFLRVNNIFAKLSRLSDVLIALSSTMTYPVYNFPSIVQGCALLYFVPYFRRSILRFLGVTRIEDSPIPSIQAPHSVNSYQTSSYGRDPLPEVRSWRRINE